MVTDRGGDAPAVTGPSADSHWSPIDAHHQAWEVAVRSYLDTVEDGHVLYETDASFHAAVYLGGDVVTCLLALTPEGPPHSGLEHLTRRIAMTSQAAIVEHRGQMDATSLLAAGWTWAEGEEHAFGKRGGVAQAQKASHGCTRATLPPMSSRSYRRLLAVMT